MPDVTSGRILLIQWLLVWFLPFASCVPSGETELERRRVSPIHRARLSEGLVLFSQWVGDLDPLEDSMQNWDLSNQCLVDFVQHLYDNHYRPSHAKHALLGVQDHWKWLKGKLPRPWAALRAWQKEVGTRSRIPISLEFLQGFFGVAISWALESPEVAHLLLPLAILARLGFECCLRVGEILALTVGDVLLPRLGSVSDVAVIAIRRPKNRGAMGLEQFSTTKSVSLIAWLRWMLEGLPAQAKLRPSSPYNFRTSFKNVFKRMQLDHLGLLPSSLRAGGCTHHFLIDEMPIPTLRYKVRHTSEATLASYVQEAVAAMTFLSLTKDEERMLYEVVSGSKAIWAAPPQVTWESLFSRCRQLQSLHRLSFSASLKRHRRSLKPHATTSPARLTPTPISRNWLGIRRR